MRQTRQSAYEGKVFFISNENGQNCQGGIRNNQGLQTKRQKLTWLSADFRARENNDLHALVVEHFHGRESVLFVFDCHSGQKFQFKLKKEK